MRHSGWMARVLFLALTAAVSATVFAAAAEPGSQSDPLVTLSYLNDTYLAQVLDKVDAKIARRNSTLSAQIDLSGADVVLPDSGSSAAFSVVTLSQGQTLTGAIGCEVMLRVGTAVCVSPSSPGLIDESSAATLNNSGALVTNHLYMMTIEGRGVKATAATVKLLVRGSYTIA